MNGGMGRRTQSESSSSPAHPGLVVATPSRLDQNRARGVNTDGTLTLQQHTVTGLPPGLQYIESIIGGNMFKFLTLEERNRRLEAENNLLRAKNQQLEDALLELAQISEVKHGETVPTEDK